MLGEENKIIKKSCSKMEKVQSVNVTDKSTTPFYVKIHDELE